MNPPSFMKANPWVFLIILSIWVCFFARLWTRPQLQTMPSNPWWPLLSEWSSLFVIISWSPGLMLACGCPEHMWFLPECMPVRFGALLFLNLMQSLRLFCKFGIIEFIEEYSWCQALCTQLGCATRIWPRASSVLLVQSSSEVSIIPWFKIPILS